MTDVVVTATVPLRQTPVWAVLERRLFDILDVAWREFEVTYCAPDGSLVYAGAMHGRDGVDDFYEPFFNWPVLYRLGGADDLLAAAKHHWEGVTAQMTAVGFVRDEFELGYDWFHLGESLIFFYSLCAADPEDAVFRERAQRFADMYLADSPLKLYDAGKRMIVAPHTGSGGPRWGVGEDWNEYSASQTGMKPYGLPLHDVDGIHSWDDLADDENAKRMGDAMQERMGRGDTAINLASTSLVTNAWLYAHDDRYSDWVQEYVGAWRERAEQSGGILPDNVGPSGEVGELHNGAWYGGHYGWTWPHGLHSVEAVAMIASINDSLVTSDPDALDLARAPLDAVIELGVLETEVSTKGSLGPGWAQKMGVPDDVAVRLVPYRRGPDGWFDFHPLPLTYPLWLWWLTLSDSDRERMEELERVSGFDWTTTRLFHDKEEQGHEAPWFSYLVGRNPSYPEDALGLALAQVARRIALMRATPEGPPDDDIHWWQRLNPVVTEVLTQLTTGAPPALYNGGLALARVIFGDADGGRPGLPADVAALVSEIDADGIRVELVNLSLTDARTLIVQAGSFAEDRIDEVTFDTFDTETGTYPGSSLHYLLPDAVAATTSVPVDAATLSVVLPPLTTISLRMRITRRAYTPRHVSFAAQEN